MKFRKAHSVVSAIKYLTFRVNLKVTFNIAIYFVVSGVEK